MLFSLSFYNNGPGKQYIRPRSKIRRQYEQKKYSVCPSVTLKFFVYVRVSVALAERGPMLISPCPDISTSICVRIGIM